MSGLGPLLISVISLVSIFGLISWIVTRERKKKKYSPFTEKSLRSPGYSLGVGLDKATEESMEPILGLTLTPIVYFFFLGQLDGDLSALLIAPFAGFWVFFAWLFVKRSAETRQIRLGLDGEVYTGQELNYLMRLGAYVFHDVPYKYGNIDHVIVASGGVFVVETKAVRKPAGEDGKRQSKVRVKDGKLLFPYFKTDYPLKQAKLHAVYMREFLKLKTAGEVPVVPVVALPGWFVEVIDSSDCLVINPKRGKGLRSYIQRIALSEQQIESIAKLIEEVARSVWSSTEKFDPDGAKKFDYWLDRKAEERKIE